MRIKFTDSCELCSQIPSRSLVFLGAGSEEKWYGTYTNRPDRPWDQSEENMMANCSGSGHPIFRASSAFEGGELRSKGGGKKSIHFNGSHENIELLLRTVTSANQLSIYGAVADSRNEVPKDLRAMGKLAAPDHLDTMAIPTVPSTSEAQTNAQQRAKPSARTRATIRTNVRRPDIFQNYVLMRI